MCASVLSFDVWGQVMGRPDAGPRVPAPVESVLVDRRHAAWRFKFLVRWVALTELPLTEGQLESLPRWDAEGTPAALRRLEAQLAEWGLRDRPNGLFGVCLLLANGGRPAGINPSPPRRILGFTHNERGGSDGYRTTLQIA